MPTPDKELYEKAIEKWGNDLQEIIMIEEMSELTKQICKCLRGNSSIENLDKITEEMADVEIMLEQMKIVYKNEDHVREEKKKKLDRLERLVYG